MSLARLPLLLVFVVPLTTVGALAQRSHEPLYDSAAVATIDAINRNDGAKAERSIEQHLRNDPESLQWLFLRGMLQYSRLFAVGPVDRWELANMRLTMTAVTDIGERRLDDDEDDIVALFYTGGAYGYLGIAMAADGDMFAGVGTAKKGFDLQEDLIEKCPECYDAYLGPGMMNLMTSAVPWFLKPILWLYGLSGTEEKALQYLTFGYERGTLVHLESGTYLAQLYQRREQPSEAIAVYSALMREYPMRIGLRAEGIGPYWGAGRESEIVTILQQTLDDFEASRYRYGRADSSWLPSIVVSLSQAHLALGDTVSAADVLEHFLREKCYRTIPSWRVHSSAASLYVSRQDTSRAIGHYELILSQDSPESAKERASASLKRIRSSH